MSYIFMQIVCYITRYQVRIFNTDIVSVYAESIKRNNSNHNLTCHCVFGCIPFYQAGSSPLSSMGTLLPRFLEVI